jgi:hypothetical protein
MAHLYERIHRVGLAVTSLAFEHHQIPDLVAALGLFQLGQSLENEVDEGSLLIVARQVDSFGSSSSLLRGHRNSVAGLGVVYWWDDIFIDSLLHCSTVGLRLWKTEICHSPAGILKLTLELTKQLLIANLPIVEAFTLRRGQKPVEVSVEEGPWIVGAGVEEEGGEEANELSGVMNSAGDLLHHVHPVFISAQQTPADTGLNCIGAHNSRLPRVVAVIAGTIEGAEVFE